MFFRDMIESVDEWGRYEEVLGQLSEFVGDCTSYLADAFTAAQERTATEPCYSHGTVLLLVRHVVECLDGVTLLVAKGSAENCGPLLRSAFEAHLGLLHILQADSRNRALAYQVAHAHWKIKLYRRCDADDPIGKQVRSELKGDPLAGVFDRIPGDLGAMIANLEKMFQRAEYVPIEQEWQDTRKRLGNKDPEWFALFGGPRDVRSLAISLGLGAVYEGLYRSWSDVIHAGSGFKHVGPSDQPGAISIRPIRHPDGLESACTLSAWLAVSTTNALVAAYAPGHQDAFQRRYAETIRQRHLELCGKKIINAPWR